MQPVVDRQAIEQLAKVFGFAAASHVVLLLGLINKDSRGQSGTFWSTAGLKDGSYFDLPIDIPLALVFLLLHGPDFLAAGEPSPHPIRYRAARCSSADPSGAPCSRFGADWLAAIASASAPLPARAGPPPPAATG